LTLCAEPDDLPRYDDAFAAWFAATPPRRPAPPPARRVQTSVMALLESPPAGSGRAEEEQQPLRVAASDTEILRHRDIAGLSAVEREHLRELIATLRLDPPLRRALRFRPHRTGRLDQTRMLAAMRAAGGEPIRLP